MKFGRILREKTIAEWSFFAVDYKQLKKSLKLSQTRSSDDDSDSEVRFDGSVNVEKFDSILEESKARLGRFYADKEAWAVTYISTLEENVRKLKEVSLKNLDDSGIESQVPSRTESNSCDSSISSNEGSDNDYCTEEASERIEETKLAKEEFRAVAHSPIFKSFIYAKKSLSTYERELDLLIDFLHLNTTAFSKILKKFDKRTGSSERENRLAEIKKTLPFLNGHVLMELKYRTQKMISETDMLKPNLPKGWENRKVYTIGCFDLFHRGHANVLMSLREFGYFLVAGIHDDASYFKLKKKYPIDNLETRMKKVKPYVDQLFVIPSTDPLLYIKSVVSEQDIETGSCCYARGDDMLQFPSRDWVESAMPVYFVPRTEGCSSTLIRTIYHAEDEELRKKAAFAKTRYDGKPIDDEGNVLVLKAKQ